ncbi:hypothetical protein HJO_09144 [Hyphomonas johnsonii MHS-2]|uniref:Uncharacterized protein n=2 Tax=Hyphomonas johnsonii TaxID=81031 RepID=A0A059FNG7_9PROT|nr:hypothetical protein HJO_09144 [Hyphomonas johnsonii MHS-2]
MNPLYAPLYAHVMVLFWPWLWWQLHVIERWRRQTGRGLLIAVDQWGNVHVRFVEDAPCAASGAARAPVSRRLALALGDAVAPLWAMLAPRADRAAHPASGPACRRECGYLCPAPET